MIICLLSALFPNSIPAFLPSLTIGKSMGARLGLFCLSLNLKTYSDAWHVVGA